MSTIKLLKHIAITLFFIVGFLGIVKMIREEVHEREVINQSKTK